MHVLVFRHVEFEHLGWIAPALESAGVSYEYVDLFEAPHASIRLDSFDGVISMGGPMSANDDLPLIERELELLRAAVNPTCRSSAFASDRRCRKRLARESTRTR